MSATATKRPLSTRFGAFGTLAKRVVERLIRFYTVRQDEVNLGFEERLRDLEAAPVSHRGSDLDLRAQCAALSARLTHVQRETAVLRERLAAADARIAELEKPPS